MTGRVRLAVWISSVLCICASAASYGLAEEPHWQHVAATQGLADSYTMKLSGGELRVDFAPGALDLGDDPVLAHIRTAADAVVAYFGRFPVSRARVLVIPVANRSGSPQGTTWGDMDGWPGFTRLRVGQHSTQADLDDDWVTTHELVHMAFPSQEREHHWIEEGMATYVEPLARVKTGELTAQKVWRDMFRDIHQGEPESGDEGLDHTHTWGRTYWGGALFCLVADVEIRRETKNRKGLGDALRGIVAAGGTIDQEWPLDKAFDVGDKATGTHVLTTMYAAWKDAPVTVDLDKLWSELGIKRADDGVEFVPNAPDAKVREAIAGNATASR